MTSLMRPARRLGWATFGLGLMLMLALGLIIYNQTLIRADQSKIGNNERRIATLQLQLGQLEQSASAGRAESKLQQLLVQALQRQIRHLGATPVAIPPSQTDSDSGGSSGAPSPSRTSRPTPSPRRTPRPAPNPSRSPSPSPYPSSTRVCLTSHLCLPKRLEFFWTGVLL